MTSILLSAYACRPGSGSEPGIGWNWAIHLASRFRVVLVTDLSNQTAIEQHALPQNLIVRYHAVPSFLTRWLNVERERTGRRCHYILWQLSVASLFRRLIEQFSCSLIHHVTYIQLLTPSPGFWSKVPFVFGPAGGAEVIPRVFYRDLGISSISRDIVRRVTRVGMKLLSRMRGRVRFVFSSPSGAKAVYGSTQGCDVMPAVYLDEVDRAEILGGSAAVEGQNNDDRPLVFIAPGRMIDWKGLELAIRSIRLANAKGVRVTLKIVGAGPLSARLHHLATSLGISDSVSFVGRIKKRELLTMLSGADGVLYLGFRDSGAMVVTEAYLMGLPAIVLDIDSQFYLPATAAVKISPDGTYDSIVQAIATALVARSRPQLKELGRRGRQLLGDGLSWECKISRMSEIYQELMDAEPSRLAQQRATVTAL